MVAPAAEGIDLFKIAGRSNSGWIPSLKTSSASHVGQPFRQGAKPNARDLILADVMMPELV